MLQQKQQEKGSALIIVMILIFSMIAIEGAQLLISVRHASLTRTEVSVVTAQYTCKGGIELATRLMNKKKTSANKPSRIEGIMGVWDSFIYLENGVWYKFSNDAAAPTSDDGSNAYKTYAARDAALTSGGNWRFRATVVSNESGKTLDEATSYAVNVSAVYDRQGYGMRGFLNRNITTVSGGGKKIGSFGDEEFKIGENGSVDSYDSDPSTAPGGTNGVYTGNNIRNQAAIGSNGNLVVDGNNPYMLYGKAYVYQGGSVNAGADAKIDNGFTGQDGLEDVSTLATKIDYSTVTESAPVNASISENALGVSNRATDYAINIKNGDNLTLSSGTYYMDSLDMANGGNLKVAAGAEVIVYVKGDFTFLGGTLSMLSTTSKLKFVVFGQTTFSGNFSVPTGFRPDNFVVRSANTGTESGKEAISISGDAKIYGVFDAPKGKVELQGSSEVFGALIGKRVDIGSSIGSGNRAKLHVDESLQYGRPETSSSTYDYYMNANIKNAFQDVP